MKSINDKLIIKRVIFDSPNDGPSSLWNQIFHLNKFHIWDQIQGDINRIIYQSVRYVNFITYQLKEHK